MPLPDGYLPREGDELLVRVRVRHAVEAGEDNVHVNPSSRPYSNFVVDKDDIHAVYCRTWKPGEKARVIGAPNTYGEVIAIAEGCVWLKMTDGQFLTFGANALEAKIDPIDEPFVEPIKPPTRQPVDDKDEIPF